MRKYLLSFFALVWAICAVNAQKFESTETRDLPTFNKIKASSSFDVVLVQGNAESAKVSVKNVALNEIITEVRGGELCLEFEEKARNKYRNYNMAVKVEITFQKLESIKLSGSGNVKSDTPIKSEHLTLKVSGSGNINLAYIEALKLDSQVSGSGNITLKGKADEHITTVSGSGNYKATELTTLRTNAKVSGSGNLSINVSEELVARISGSGNIRYKGNPKSKDVDKSGSGSVHSMD